MIGSGFYRQKVRSYTPFCPICGSEKIGEDSSVNAVAFGYKIRYSCNSCGSLWNLRMGAMNREWVELEKEAFNGAGKDLRGKKFNMDQIRTLVSNKMATMPKPIQKEESEDTVAKEIIKEKEVVVKVRCPYCKNTYAETLDKCPHCGAHG